MTQSDYVSDKKMLHEKSSDFSILPKKAITQKKKLIDAILSLQSYYNIWDNFDDDSRPKIQVTAISLAERDSKTLATFLQKLINGMEKSV